MIGALILKMALRSTMADLNNRRKDRIVSHYADDAVLTYPGNFSMSGVHRGKVVELEDCYSDVHCLQEMWGE